MPITQTMLETAARTPDQPAIVGADRSVTYRELLAQSQRLASVLGDLRSQARAGEGAGIPVLAVSVESAFEAARIVGALAGHRAVAAVIDPRWPLAHRVRVAAAAGIDVIVSDDPALPGALRGAGWQGAVLTPAELRERERRAAPAAPPAVRADDEPFLLLFSSGTTADPKAFLKTRRQYRANLAVSSAHLEPLPGVATLAPGPLSYSLTLYAVIESLGTGGSVHVADSVDPVAAGRRIEAEGITRVVAVPAIVQALATAARRDPARFAGVEVVVTGGANLPRSIRDSVAERMPGARLISYYGAAEIGFIGDSRGGDGTLIDVYDAIRVEIRDGSGQALPDGEIGTLWVRAAACSDGYLPGTSSATLRGPDGWASVGDQGRIVGGRLELLGRAGDIAVTGGHMVALPEVERAFASLPGVRAACAVALPDPVLGSVVALAFEGQLAKRELQAHAASSLAPQFVPRRWIRVAELPRTVGGKIRRSEAVRMLERGEGERL